MDTNLQVSNYALIIFSHLKMQTPLDAPEISKKLQDQI